MQGMQSGEPKIKVLISNLYLYIHLRMDKYNKNARKLLSLSKQVHSMDTVSIAHRSIEFWTFTSWGGCGALSEQDEFALLSRTQATLLRSHPHPPVSMYLYLHLGYVFICICIWIGKCIWICLSLLCFLPIPIFHLQAWIFIHFIHCNILYLYSLDHWISPYNNVFHPETSKLRLNAMASLYLYLYFYYYLYLCFFVW